MMHLTSRSALIYEGLSCPSHQPGAPLAYKPLSTLLSPRWPQHWPLLSICTLSSAHLHSRVRNHINSAVSWFQACRLTHLQLRPYRPRVCGTHRQARTLHTASHKRSCHGDTRSHATLTHTLRSTRSKSNPVRRSDPSCRSHLTDNSRLRMPITPGIMARLRTASLLLWSSQTRTSSICPCHESCN